MFPNTTAAEDMKWQALEKPLDVTMRAAGIFVTIASGSNLR
jgi:hypothetical protein